jgi:hypothetical protein
LALYMYLAAPAWGRLWHLFTGLRMGRARQLCPGISDLDSLRDLKGIVDLDAEVADGAFDVMASGP